MMRFAASDGAAYNGSNKRARVLVRSPRAMERKREGTKGRSVSTETMMGKFQTSYQIHRKNITNHEDTQKREESARSW